MSINSLLARLRNIRSFIGVSRSRRQLLPLALLGWARGNPSSIIQRSFPAVSVKPSPLRGGTVTVNSRDLGQLISFQEIFVDHAYDLSLVPFVPNYIVDCGGHVGYFSALAGAAYPQAKLVVFEPNPMNLAWLRGNISALGEQVLLHEAAVSNFDGFRCFDAEFSNSGCLNKEGNRLGYEVAVKDLAKFFETHDGAGPREHLVTLLKDAGFSVTLLRERGDFADLFAVRCAV
jgi:FkbM family methyltransferase